MQPRHSWGAETPRNGTHLTQQILGEIRALFHESSIVGRGEMIPAFEGPF